MNTISPRSTGNGGGILKHARRLFCAAAATAILLPQGANAAWVPQSGTGARYDSNVHFIDANTGWFTAGTKVRKTTNGGATWVELTPTASSGLTGIHFVDANTGWASGYFGAITKTTNGGASWTAQTHPTGAHCFSVFALNSNLAWQAGSSGMLGRTTNGGATWLGSEGNPAGNPGFGQYDVHFTDANTGYSVAGGNWSAKTVNGGVTWTQMSTSNAAQLYKVTFADANTGWAVGVNGTILKTSNAGASWTTQTSGTTENLTGVSFVNANVGWVVGGNGTILSTVNGGTTWAPEVSGSTEYLGDVHFVDATHGWVVGDNNTVLAYDAGAPPAATDVVFVANHSGSTIRKFTAPGVSTVFADSADGLSGPEGIAFDSAGNMFVTNSGNSTVVKILPNGAASVFADSADGISQPYGIAIDAANNLYVGNAGALTVTKLSPAGAGTVLGTCSGPFVRGVAVDSTGNVYVANAGSKIERFTPAGSRTTYYDGAVLSHSNGLTFDGAGVLYCADFNQNKVVKFATPGVPTTYANTLMSSPLGIRFGTDGKLYVANYGGSSVTNYTTAGAGTTFANSGNGISGPTAVGIFSGPILTTLINDNFDDGATATNTLGTGAGFVSRGQVASTESGGFLNLDNNAGASTRVYTSNTANALNPFQTLPTTMAYTFGAVNRGAEHQRLWIGYRTSSNSNNHFYPNTNIQGLYVSVISQNFAEDGFPQLGNLVAVSNTGVSTTLASWNWANSNALSGLTVSLTTTGTQYALQFSGAAGSTPTFVTGAAAGTLSGLGTLGGNFDCAIHNQYWFDNGGGVKLDRVLVQRSSAPFNFPPSIVLPASPLIVEATSASGAIATYSITGTDPESGALTGSGVPASGSTFTLGDTTVTGSVTDGTNTATGTFIVRVRDTIAPVVTAPANVSAASTSMAGATVTYSAASATDAVTASPLITYSHASGATFPVGITTVTASAADGAGNIGTATFTVTVQALAGTLTFANATPSANPVNGSGVLNVVPVVITRTSGTLGAITAEVVPSQPATVPTGFAKYVYGTDYEFVSGTSAGSTVSFANGQASATVDIVLKTPVLTKKGQLKLTLTTAFGGAIIGSPADSVLTINARDTAAPTLVLATPVAGATFDITGTVKDAGGLASLTVKVNGATLPLTVNPVTGYVANAIAPYSVLGAIAENGANVIIVTATDPSGNTATMTKTVTHLNNRPALTGTYTALIKPTGTPDGDTTGFLTTTVTDAGKLTGKVTLSGVTIPFTGLLNNAGAATFGTTGAAALDLLDSTEFDAYLGALAFSVSSPGGLSGTLKTSASGGTILATCTGTKTPYSATNLVPAGLLTAATKGVYSVAFPSKAQSPVLTNSAYPQGDGYATLTLTNAGGITILGKFADGTALSASGNLRADGTLPFFASLYKKLGLVAGDLTFANLTDSDLSGSDLLWIRPAQTTAQYYRTGWASGIRIDAVGAKYVSPAALDFGQGAVDTVNGNAALVFTDGQLASTITHNVNVAPATGVITRVPVVGAPYTLALVTSTGVFSGTFTHGGATDTYRGVLINKGANKAGFGYFLSTVPLIVGASGESGSVSLQP